MNCYLEKYNKIWDKPSDTIKEDFESKPITNEKYLLKVK